MDLIQFQTKPHSDEETLALLHPVIREWWTSSYQEFSPPQRYAILNIHRGENTLISSPTGSGKTLSAFLAIINNLAVRASAGELDNRVYCIYVSPLKALANDITRNLTQPLKAIEALARRKGEPFGIRVGTRTGDTTPSQRARMLKRPPHILITTPESLALMLVTTKFRQLLTSTEYLIIDEIHALAENKRGVNLSLTAERLQAACGQLVRIGLSATVHPLEEVARFLVGKEGEQYRPCKIVDVQGSKQHDLKVLCPVKDLLRTTHRAQQDALYRLLHQLIQEHRTTLIFTNTRGATERVVHELKTRYPQDYQRVLDGEAGERGLIGAHHGSLSKAHRHAIEQQLKQGALKAVVCSTSLELGIDIGSIDLVILLGSPKSVARALQRIGRAGHRLHETAKGRIIVLDRDDMVECSVLLKAAMEHSIDRIHIPRNALDVLAQQIFALAIEERRHIDEIRAIVRRSHCYATLSDEDFRSVIHYLAGDYASLEQRHVYAKIWYDEQTGEVGRRGKLARLIYLTNAGTIPDETRVTVKIGEEVIGTIDEGFLERLKPGDVFVLGGDTYEFRYSRGLTAQVRTSAGRPPTVPNWVSEMLPLSYDLAVSIQRFRRYLDELFTAGRSKEDILNYIRGYLYADEHTVHSIYEYVREQASYASIPHDRRLLIEHFRDGNKRYTIVHSLYGRRVNDVLSRALAYVLGRLHNRDVAVTISDNGFSLRSTTPLNVRRALALITPAELTPIMHRALEKSEVLSRRFRHCAARALMILRSYKGASKSVGKQQMSSRLLLNAARRISDDFPILKEARREVLEDLMDLPNALTVIRQLSDGRITIEEITRPVPSPFAFSIILGGYTDILKIEEKKAFLRRMHEAVLQQIATGNTGAPTFHYEDFWATASDDTLKREAWNLPDTPLHIKEGLTRVLDGEPDPRIKDYLAEHAKDIQQTWSRALRERLHTVLGLPPPEHEDEERVLLRRQLRRVRRELDPEVFTGIEALIDGREADAACWAFIDELLSKPVPRAWQDELVKFLMRRREASNSERAQ